MKNFVEWIRSNIGTALTATGILSGIVGFGLNDFASWRTANREFIKSQMEAGQKADQDLIDILRKFSDKARGLGATTGDDLRLLQSTITKSYLVASALSERYPAIKPDVQQYFDSLMNLQKSAAQLSGPLEGQSFVEAVAAFGAKRKVLQQRISALQASWPL